MNLFERFWNSINEPCGSGGVAPASEVIFTHIEPPEGSSRTSEVGRDLAALVRRAPRHRPPCTLAQPEFSERPFCAIYTVAGGELPPFQELFEQYVDKNAFMAETFLRLKPHVHVPYLLFLGERCFYLFDAQLEELLRWGNEFAALEELLLQPLSQRQDVAAAWNAMPRKPVAQRSEEFARWLDLWKVALGARTNANPAFMQHLLQKVLLLFLYDQRFGLNDPCLSLRTNFLDTRPVPARRPPARPRAGILPVPAVEKSEPQPVIETLPAPGSPISGAKKKGRGTTRAPLPFDGVAWVHEAADEVVADFGPSFLQWTQAEHAFFALLNGDARSLFSQFVLDLFLLSHAKFDSAVQTDAFSDVGSRMKLWKFAVTETLNVRARLHADDVNVYEPVAIDLEEAGLGWAVHVVEQVLDFWRERCAEFRRQLEQCRAVPVQFDMFQQPDLSAARVPLPEEALQTALETSIRVHYDFPANKATLEYLVLLRVMDFCRRWNLPLDALGYVSEIFVQKQRVADVQEI